jgi:hypothetical protein
VFVGETYRYTQEKVDKLSGKGFLGNYGQENIVFSENHTKVEYCYYNEDKRISYGYHYRLINDSTLYIGDTLIDGYQEKWTFKQLSNKNYSLHRKNNGLRESGEVDCLIPLHQVRPFVTINGNDTLWKTNDFTINNRKYGYYHSDFYVSQIAGKIYEFDEVDFLPNLLNNDSLPTINIESIHPCICAPMTWITTVSVTITAKGDIKNIEQALGNISNNCSYTMMEINRIIASWGKVKPATVNGTPVNVRWFIRINDLSQPETHPSLADTYANRKAFLKQYEEIQSTKKKNKRK